MIKVHYKGQLIDRTVFDSSYKRNQPIEFKLGVGQVIKGWDEGIALLNVGEKARFLIPPNLAFEFLIQIDGVNSKFPKYLEKYQ